MTFEELGIEFNITRQRAHTIFMDEKKRSLAERNKAAAGDEPAA